MSRLVSVRSPEYGRLIVKKSRGALTVDDLFDAFRENKIEGIYAIFVQRPEFDGYLGESEDKKVTAVMLYEVSNTDHCPACGKSMEDWRGQWYESTFQDGYQAGFQAVQEEKGKAGS